MLREKEETYRVIQRYKSGIIHVSAKCSFCKKKNDVMMKDNKYLNGKVCPHFNGKSETFLKFKELADDKKDTVVRL